MGFYAYDCSLLWLVHVCLIIIIFFFGLRSQEGWFLNMRNEQVKNHLSYFQRKSFGNYVRTN